MFSVPKTHYIVGDSLTFETKAVYPFSSLTVH